MDLKSAIMERISRRKFELDPVDGAVLEQLEAAVWECNRAAGMNIKIKLDDGEAFSGSRSKGMFSGACNYFAMICKKDDPDGDEKIGYYGESLILLATRLGLGTCWVGGTFDKKSVSPQIGPGEKLWDVIPIGYPAKKMPMKQRIIRDGLRKKTPAPEKMVEGDTEYKDLPEWVKAGLQAILDGPSAVNRLPVHLVCEKNNYFLKIYKENGGFEWNDLGIAKYQFWYAANALDVHGEWEWGSGGEFQIKAQQIEDLYQ